MITSIKCYYVHSSETFHTFYKMLYNMPQIIFEYSLDFSRTFPRMFGDIPRNVWRHSSEYNIPPIPRVPRIPFPVPVFLVLYIAGSGILTMLTIKTLFHHYLLLIWKNFTHCFALSIVYFEQENSGWVTYFHYKKTKSKYFSGHSSIPQTWYDFNIFGGIEKWKVIIILVKYISIWSHHFYFFGFYFGKILNVLIILSL